MIIKSWAVPSCQYCGKEVDPEAPGHGLATDIMTSRSQFYHTECHEMYTGQAIHKLTWWPWSQVKTLLEKA